jgi:hypothetical protein
VPLSDIFHFAAAQVPGVNGESTLARIETEGTWNPTSSQRDLKQWQDRPDSPQFGNDAWVHHAAL